uniref:RNase H type-1 domain-containing protein n=1 Tax=Chenopodium quinoa TaxID=63459 RepID=A0A803LFT2_CHEQI
MRDDLPPDDTPWLVLGDLNEVMFPNEKMGGCSFCQSQANDLRMLVDAACLVDLGFNGNPYTWHNAREGCANIRERLDRALANPIWLNTFLNTQALKTMARDYFIHIFISSSSDINFPCNQAYSFPKHLEDDIILHLQSCPTAEEIRLNLKAMNGINSPGPNGIQVNADYSCNLKFSRVDKDAPSFSSMQNLGTSPKGILKSTQMDPGWPQTMQVLETNQICHTDAQALCYMLENPKAYMDHQLAVITKDVADLLQRQWSITLLHVKRSANKIAHGLASIGKEQSDDGVVLYYTTLPHQPSLTSI